MSRLIAKEDVGSAGHRPVALNLCDVEQKAREAVDRAKAEARRILTEAVAHAREAERVARARGEKAGYDDGVKAGREAGKAQAYQDESRRIQEETAGVREALLEMLNEIEAHRHEVVSDAKQGLLRLAVAIAERVCRARIQQDGEHVRPLIEEVIETTGRQSGLLVRAHPSDVKTIEAFIGDIHQSMGGDASSPIRLVADEAIERGGCIARHVGGQVDARVETQISRIVSELMGADVAKTCDAGESA